MRLIPVTERGKQLFGESGADAIADEMEAGGASSMQLSLFPEEPPDVRGRPRRRARGAAVSLDNPEDRRDATTLDRVHAGHAAAGVGSEPGAAQPRCALSRSAGRISCALPTPCPPCILAAVRRSGCWTPCCWRRRGDGLV